MDAYALSLSLSLSFSNIHTYIFSTIVTEDCMQVQYVCVLIYLFNFPMFSLLCQLYVFFSIF